MTWPLGCSVQNVSLVGGLLAVTALAGVVHTHCGLTDLAGVEDGEARCEREAEVGPQGTVRVGEQVGGSGTVGGGGRLA